MFQRAAPKFKLRSFVEEDIPDILKMDTQSTFKYSAESLKLWNKRDPGGLIVAVLDSGKVAGLCAVVNHNEEVAFGGAFSVYSEHREIDIGNKILGTAIQHAENRNLGANCSADKLNFYKKLGFHVFEPAWTSLEYSYLGEVEPDLLSDKLPNNVEIKPFEESYLKSMFAYDRCLAGYDRSAILEASCQETNTVTLVAFNDDVCVGFGIVKRNNLDVACVGPLYSDDPLVGEVMFRKLLEAMPNVKGLAMSTISSNSSANEWFKRLEIPIHDNLFRIYTKQKMLVNTRKIFAQLDVNFSPF